MKYRADIDGLRAFAILPVVLFHAGFSFMQGGYIGVDVFFVISGFLITSILIRDIQDKKFSIIKFYERRIRRLFPALIATLILTFWACYFILLPQDYISFTKSLLSSLVFATNLYFYFSSGYFDTAAQSKPLLHTWSLAVEEQYYIIFPLFIYIIYTKCFRYRQNLVALATFASFLVSIKLSTSSQTAGFYLLHSRAWELLLGSLLALMPASRRTHPQFAQATSIISLVTILLCSVLYSARTPFPGLSALPPCLSAALLIYTGSSNTWGSKILSAPLFVFIGKISYSLYLIHWPAFVLYEYHVARDLHQIERIAILLLSTILASAFWLYIETPFRRKLIFHTRQRLFGTATIALSIITIVPYFTATARNKIIHEKFPITVTFEDRNSRRKECHGIPPEKILQGGLCRIGEENHPPDFISWGDSHMDAIMPALEEIASREKLSGWHATYSACPPLVGAKYINAPKNFRCEEFNDAMLETIRKNGIKNVIISARWIRDYNNLRIERTRLTRYISWNGSSQDDVASAIASSLEHTISRLEALGTTVWIVDQIPEFSRDVPNMIFQNIILDNSPESIGIPYGDFQSQSNGFTSILNDLAKKYKNIHIVRPSDALCADQILCRAATEQFAIYRDEHHLTPHGAKLLIPLFYDFIMHMQKPTSTLTANGKQ